MTSVLTPPSVSRIAEPLHAFSGKLVEQVQTALSKLTQLEALHSHPPLCTEAQQLQHLSDELMQLQCAGVSLCVHPYQYGVGLNGTLSADTALNMAAAQLIGEAPYSVYGHWPQSYGVVLVVSAPTPSQFASRLNAVTEVFAFPQWLALSNLAAKHSVLAIERAQIPKVRPGPYWQGQDVSLCAPLYQVNEALGSALGAVDACASNTVSPAARLQQLAQKQVTRLGQLQDKLQSLSGLFHGQVYATKLGGSPAVLAKQLRDFRTDNEPHAAALIFLSDTETVLLNEALGL